MRASALVSRPLDDPTTPEHALELLEAVLEATGDGILVADLAGRVTRYNQRLLELWRLPDRGFVGAECGRLLAELASQARDRDDALARVDALRASADSESVEVIELADGRVYEL